MWVTRPERRSQAGPKGRQLEVGPQDFLYLKGHGGFALTHENHNNQNRRLE